MLKKLIKYDLTYQQKALSVFYVLALLFALLTRLFFSLEQSFLINLLGQICTGATISMIVNILINNTLRFWVRFKDHLYGDLSYLTHTLPVKKTTHYLAKFTAGVISMFISMAVIVLSLLVAYYSKENFTALKALLFPLGETTGVHWWGLLLLMVVLIFLELVHLLQSGFGGTVLGHKNNQHKILLSMVCGGALYFAGQTVAFLPVAVGMLFSQGLRDLLVVGAVVTPQALITLLWLAIVGYVLLTPLMAFINAKLLAQGVNVD